MTFCHFINIWFFFFDLHPPSVFTSRFPQWPHSVDISRLRFCAHLMFVPLLQFGSENQQLEWAKRESEREEQERVRRLRLQEQQDLELALALSRAEMSGSWPGLPHRSSSSSSTISWQLHQHWPHVTSSPCYQFVQTSDSAATTGRMSNDSTFSNQLWVTAQQLQGTYN